MPIPAEILAVPRPKNTRVKKDGNKYDVIKRTSKIKNGKPYPVELGKIGEIVDGKYVEAKTSRLDFSKCDIKNYGRTELAYRLSKDIYKDLLEIYDVSDASKIYTIALLRAAYSGICDRDIKFKYDISYISEEIKNVALAPSTISKFLDLLGRNYNRIKAFMDERIKKVNDNTKIIVDGMLKDCNCDTSDFTKWSRKSRLKGSENISILYAFNLTTGEPLVHKIYSGNCLDSTSFSDFIDHFNLKDCLIMGDKGFISPETFDKINNHGSNLRFLFPIKRNDKRLSTYNMFNYTEEFIIDSDHILAKKNKTDDGLYLYTFKSLEDEANEKKGYLKNQHKKNSFDNDKLNVKTITLGTISFISNLDFNPKDIYKMYETRWEIELFFNFYKNVAGLESVRVQDNTSIIGSEFINFISSIISIRIKKEFIKTKLYDKYSYCQIMDKLGQLDVYLDANSNKWVPTNKIKYIEEIAKTLNLYSA